MKLWWGFHNFHFQKHFQSTYSLLWNPYYSVQHFTFEWRHFRANVCTPSLYFFLVTIWHKKTMCAGFFIFWFFLINYAHLKVFEVSHLILGFFVKMHINHIYIFFLVTIVHYKTMCAGFLIFFELVMLNPHKTPLTEAKPRITSLTLARIFGRWISPTLAVRSSDSRVLAVGRWIDAF